MFSRKRKRSEEFVAGRVVISSSSERRRGAVVERRKLQKLEILRRVAWSFLFVVGVLAVWGCVALMISWMSDGEEVLEEVSWEPQVRIVNEGGAQVSGRVREFVAKVEKDLMDLGIKVFRVVLPLGKMKEVDVYVEGRGEYYKLTVERGSSEQAEDIQRVGRYLAEKDLSPSYVDLRVEGKAYYK